MWVSELSSHWKGKPSLALDLNVLAVNVCIGGTLPVCVHARKSVQMVLHGRVWSSRLWRMYRRPSLLSSLSSLGRKENRADF